MSERLPSRALIQPPHVVHGGWVPGDGAAAVLADEAEGARVAEGGARDLHHRGVRPQLHATQKQHIEYVAAASAASSDRTRQAGLPQVRQLSVSVGQL